MGGSSRSSGKNELRFPPYLETAHKRFIEGNEGKNLMAAFNAAWDSSPYHARQPIEAEDGMLGAGYSIEQFPSLFDVFGKFMAGLDIEVLWSQMYQGTVNSPEFEDMITAHSKELTEELEEEAYPRLHAGMRDISAVHSSAFAVGRSLLEAKRLKELSAYSAKIKMQGLLLAQDRWSKHLDWNKVVVSTYAELQKLFYATAFDADSANMESKVKNELWNLMLFDNVRTALGALTGTPAAGNAQSPSGASRAIGGALSGTAMGMATGNPIAAVAGGALGLASAIF